MPKGVYKRKKHFQSTPEFRNKISVGMKKSWKNRNDVGLVENYELVIANMDTINLLLKLINDIKKNKIGRIK